MAYCQGCDPGYFSNNGPGQPASTGCVACADGTFSGANASACTPCAPGTSAGRHAARCVPCTRGLVSRTAGSPQCAQCPVSSFWHNASSCTACPPSASWTGSINATTRRQGCRSCRCSGAHADVVLCWSAPPSSITCCRASDCSATLWSTTVEALLQGTGAAGRDTADARLRATGGAGVGEDAAATPSAGTASGAQSTSSFASDAQSTSSFVPAQLQFDATHRRLYFARIGSSSGTDSGPPPITLYSTPIFGEDGRAEQVDTPGGSYATYAVADADDTLVLFADSSGALSAKQPLGPNSGSAATQCRFDARPSVHWNAVRNVTAFTEVVAPLHTPWLSAAKVVQIGINTIAEVGNFTPAEPYPDCVLHGMPLTRMVANRPIGSCVGINQNLGAEFRTDLDRNIAWKLRPHTGTVQVMRVFTAPMPFKDGCLASAVDAYLPSTPAAYARLHAAANCTLFVVPQVINGDTGAILAVAAGDPHNARVVLPHHAGDLQRRPATPGAGAGATRRSSVTGAGAGAGAGHSEGQHAGQGAGHFAASDAVAAPGVRGTPPFTKAAAIVAGCLACPRGTFAKADDAQRGPHCEPCQPGTSSASLGALSCAACARGHFASAPAQAACMACAQGFFANTTGSRACHACPAGTSSANATASTACAACAPGTFAARPGSVCSPCPSGSHAPHGGLSACLPCPNGTFAAATGAIACLPCRAGHFSPRGAAQCVPCPPGQWEAATGASRCRPCPAGTAAGSSATGSRSVSACKPCGIGTWSTAGATRCELCAPGHFGSAAGLQSANCSGRCSPGYSCSAGSSSATASPCPAGHYCPGGSTAAPPACPPRSACPAGSPFPSPSPPRAAVAVQLTATTVRVAWHAPVASGMPHDAPVTSYSVSAVPLAISVTVPGSSLNATVTNLPAGTATTMQVVAVNAYGMRSAVASATSVLLTCIPACSSNGNCVRGACSCFSGWAGATCSSWAWWKTALAVAGGVVSFVSFVGAVYKIRQYLRKKWKARRAAKAKAKRPRASIAMSPSSSQRHLRAPLLANAAPQPSSPSSPSPPPPPSRTTPASPPPPSPAGSRSPPRAPSSPPTRVRGPRELRGAS